MENIRIYGIQSIMHACIAGKPDTLVFTDVTNKVFDVDGTRLLVPSREMTPSEGIYLAEYNERYKPPLLMTSEFIPADTVGLSTHVVFVKDGKLCEDRQYPCGLVLASEVPVYEYDAHVKRIGIVVTAAESTNRRAFEAQQKSVDAKIHDYLLEHQKKLGELMTARDNYRPLERVPAPLEMLITALRGEDKSFRMKSGA